MKSKERHLHEISWNYDMSWEWNVRRQVMQWGWVFDAEFLHPGPKCVGMEIKTSGSALFPSMIQFIS